MSVDELPNFQEFIYCNKSEKADYDDILEKYKKPDVNIIKISKGNYDKNFESPCIASQVQPNNPYFQILLSEDDSQE